MIDSYLDHLGPALALLFAAVVGLLAATSILAAVIPARRAAAVDPMTALRYD